MLTFNLGQLLFMTAVGLFVGYAVGNYFGILKGIRSERQKPITLNLKEYRYVYQRHPFDGPQYFTVMAEDPTDADLKAMKYFEQELFDKRVTVMTTFHRYFLP